jgi:hypothetical protein
VFQLPEALESRQSSGRRRRCRASGGEYRTKRLILERFDAMVAADAASVAYEPPLDPPPGDPRAAHGSSQPARTAA